MQRDRKQKNSTQPPNKRVLTSNRYSEFCIFRGASFKSLQTLSTFRLPRFNVLLRDIRGQNMTLTVVYTPTSLGSVWMTSNRTDEGPQAALLKDVPFSPGPARQFGTNTRKPSTQFPTTNPETRTGASASVQGYLAHTKPPTPLGLP